MTEGFTLAEVLITLAIIGVVAAMTIPTLVSEYKVKQTVTQIKATYSILDRAFLSAIQEEGTVDYWTSNLRNTIESSTDYMDKLKPHIKLIKDKGPVSNDISKENGVYSATLANGTEILIAVQNPACSNNRGNSEMLHNCCGWIDFDLNGEKSPNVFGVDRFELLITKYGLIPYGVQGMWVSAAQPESSYFEKNCRNYGTSGWTGYGCAAWVIYHENMDYLHCNDLQWNGKTQCK